MHPTRVPLLIIIVGVPFAMATPGLGVTGAWQSPAGNVSPSGTSAYSAQVVMTPSGSATTLSSSADGANRVINAWTLAGTTWGAATRVSGATGEAAQQALAGNSSGQMGAAWAAGSGGAYELQAATGSADGWSTPVTVPGAGSTAPIAATAVDEDGFTTVAWLQVDGSHPSTESYVRAIRWQGSFWSAPENLSVKVADLGVGHPRVGVDAAGVVTAIWTESGNVKVRRLSGGTWDAAITLDNSRLAQQARIAVEPGGRATAIWMKANGGNQDVQYARFDGTNWSNAATIAQPAAPHDGPAIAVDGTGVVTAAWRRNDGGNYRVAAAQMQGESWGATELISPAGVSSGEPAVASGPGGSAVAAWVNIGNRRVQAAWWSGTAWGAPVALSPEGANARVTTDTPSVAVDPLGSAVAVWSMESPALNVQSARFVVPPGAPGQPGVTPGDASVAVAWTAPLNNGGDAITSYTATASPGGRSCSATSTAGCTVDGLSNGTAYTFTVRASNSQGAGAASVASAAATPAGAPAPTPGPAPANQPTQQPATPQQGDAGSAVAPPAPRPLRLATQFRAAGGTGTTTGTVPRGATRITQTARTGGNAATQGFLEMARTKRATGTCRITRRTYRCTVRLSKGTWTVTTTARGKAGVVAQSTRRVVVR